MIRIFRQYFSVRKMIFVVGEGALIFVSVALASSILVMMESEGGVDLKSTWPKILIIVAITQISLYFNDLYEFKNTESAFELATRLTRSIGVTSIALAIVYFLWPSMIIGRWTFFASLVVLLFFLVSWRFLYAFVVKRNVLAENTILVGNGELASDILNEISRNKDLSYNITCVMAQNKDAHGSRLTTLRNLPNRDVKEVCQSKLIAGSVAIEGNRDVFSEEETNGSSALEAPNFQTFPHLGPSESHIPVRYGFHGMSEFAELQKSSTIIVALDEKRGIFPYKELLKCKLKGINVVDGESFYERICGKLLVEKINPSWLIFSDGFVKSPSTRIVKRLIGFITAASMLILLSPVMVLVGFAIKIESRGPMLFAQERVGEFGKVFTLYKFRSMRSDAEKMTGPVWAQENDSRVTRVGKIIRKLRIDEFPQLWNVFKGDMSFVGPRPERPFFVAQLGKKVPYYSERASVKPGITGWAQIKYPYGASEQDALEKLKYDLYYIKNMSALMDIMVIFQTVKTVLLGRGAR